jgi:uncharacterized protein (TIGR03067 family)
MRTLAWVIALAAVAPVLGDDAADKEKKKLQGAWVATALRQGDIETPRDVIAKGKVTLTIDGDKFVFETPKETHKGTVAIDPSKSPKTMDLTIPTKDGKGKVIQCIYEWDGENVRMAGDQDKRPKDFKSKLGGSIVATFKRAKK